MRESARPFVRLVLPSTLALLLAGCGGDSDDGGGGGGSSGALSIADVTLLGAVTVAQLRLPGRGESTVAGAVFSRFEVAGNIDAAELAEAQLSLEQTAAPTLDACDVYTADDDEEDLFDDEEDEGDVFGERVSAGETITLTGSSGTYATLVPAGEGDDRVYRPQGSSDGILAGFAPAGLVADIPGDVFPAFANVSIPDVAPGADTFRPMEGAATDVATEYTWSASNGAAGVLIELEFGPFFVDCLARDDGRFTLPATTVAELGENTAGRVLVAEREIVTVRQRGNALLLTISLGGTP